jgi:hypothetical protein
VCYEVIAMLSHGRRTLTWTVVTRELGIALAGYLVYFWVRGLTQGDFDVALTNARSIIDLERDLGIFWEPRLQDWILDHRPLVLGMNAIYIWGHWPVIIGIAVWLLYRHPGIYVTFRNAFLISGGIGLIIFMTFPVAPPRLTDLPVVDTLTWYSRSFHVMQPTQFTNQYAAVPSLHFGWNMLLGIALARYATAPAARIFGVVMPVAMGLAIVFTGNHYIIDAVFGAAVAMVGLLIAMRLRGFARLAGEDEREPEHIRGQR